MVVVQRRRLSNLQRERSLSMQMKTKTTIAPFFSSFCWCWLAGFFFLLLLLFFFWALSSLVSCCILCSCSSSFVLLWEKKRKKGMPRCCVVSSLSLFFVPLFSTTERQKWTDVIKMIRAQYKKRKISQKHLFLYKERAEGRKIVKTRKRALREEKASPFSVEKERATFYPFDFFRVVAIRTTTTALLYSVLFYHFLRPRRKGGRIFARCLT